MLILFPSSGCEMSNLKIVLSINMTDKIPEYATPAKLMNRYILLIEELAYGNPA